MEELNALKVQRHSNVHVLWERYDDLLDALRKASIECNFERSIRVHSGFDPTGLEKSIVRDLHLAFRSRMICDKAMDWDEVRDV